MSPIKCTGGRGRSGFPGPCVVLNHPFNIGGREAVQQTQRQWRSFKLSHSIVYLFRGYAMMHAPFFAEHIACHINHGPVV